STVVAGQEGEVPLHRVQWNDTDWAKDFVWTKRPTSHQIWYAQEDLWVLQALCEAIKDTNEGSHGAHDAGVKSIENIVVGHWAAEEAPNGTGDKRIWRPEGTGAPAQDPAAGLGEASTEAAGGKLVRPPRPLLGDSPVLASAPGAEAPAAG